MEVSKEVKQVKLTKIYNLLGLARKAGALVLGMDANLAALRAGDLALILISEDIGSNSYKQITSQAKNYGVEVKQAFTSAELGSVASKGQVAILGVKDKHFAEGIRQYFI